MQSDMIRAYKAVHTWTGIVAGLGLFIAFYAGALTIFKEPLQRWSAPPTPAVTAVPLAEAPTLIAHVLAAHPRAAEDFQLHLRPTEHRPARLGWQERAEDADDHDELATRQYFATLAADGTPHVEQSRASKVAEFIDVLHRVVGLPVDTDLHRWIMGVIAALYAVALFSGVVLFLPVLVRDFFALRVGKNRKRLWQDAHNVVGMVSLPFHLVMVVTAAGFAFHDGVYALQDRLLHDGRLASAWAGRAPSPQNGARDPATLLAPVELVARAKALSPGFVPTFLQYTRVTGPRAAVRIWGNDAAAVAPRVPGGFVALDPYSGKILTADYLPGRQTAAFTVVSSLFALHFATFGGTPVQWMYFLLGLAGAWLFYSGNLLWIESRRRMQRRGMTAPPQQRRDTQAMAALTVGVCLGTVCGISVILAAAKWLQGRVADVDFWIQSLYYAIFFACIVWAFVRGGARASVDLLWLAAACTLAIPATTLLSGLFPGLGLWAHESVAALGVDATALVGSLCFVAMARATMRRVRQGPADSVWSASDDRPPPVPAS